MPDTDTRAADPAATLEVDGASYVIVLPQADRDHIQKALLQSGEPYEWSMLRDMAARLAPDDLVLDIGANIGNHALYLAAVAGARVIAFEPNAALCAALKDSVRRNGLAARIEVRAIGLGAAAGRAHFAATLPDNLGAQALALGAGEITVAPLDALALPGPVRMIKLDVEGMEPAVLRGAQALIARDRPILYVEAQDEPTFRRLAAWAQTTDYSVWESFNATPTHLLLPGETLDLGARLERLSQREVIQDYRLGSHLRQSRKAEARTRADLAAEHETALHRQHRIETLEAEAKARTTTIATQQRRIERLEAETARLGALLTGQKAAEAAQARRHELQLAELRRTLARTEADLATLHKYGRRLEEKHTAMLGSETWRAMEPVRRVLRTLKRRPPPPPFVPQLPAKPPSRVVVQAEARALPLFAPDPARTRAEAVSVFLATFPARQHNLAGVVAAILPQCDLLTVYLNEYERVPDCLKDAKIRPILGREAAGDLKDNGKFFGTAEAPAGYHVFIDDDILYPPDYIETLVAGIRRFDFRAVAGFHGTIYRQPLASYVSDRTVLPFYAGGRATVVDQLGTGTIGYHSETHAVDLAAFETTGLADLWFARHAASCGVPLVALARRDRWLVGMEETGDTLFRQVQRDDSRETALLNERLAPVLHGGPRRRLVRCLDRLYTPEHLAQSRINLEQSMTGAFAEGARGVADVHFALIVTGWNCAGYVEKCFASIERQEIGDYSLEIHAYDDCSDDATWDRLVAQAARLQIRLLRGERNMGPAFARDILLRQVTDPHTICVLLDMDDELLPRALATLERAYRDRPDCWLTYGNWVNQNGEVNAEGAYTAEEIDTRAYRRQDVFKFTHLRSFRRFLYDRVQPEHLRDETGEWLRYCSDVGLLLPLADQCAAANVVAFDEPMYRYNQYRPSGTQKRFRDRKRETARHLRERPALERLDAAPPRDAAAPSEDAR